jgi:hypothetical protein
LERAGEGAAAVGQRVSVGWQHCVEGVETFTSLPAVQCVLVPACVVIGILGGLWSSNPDRLGVGWGQ